MGFLLMRERGVADGAHPYKDRPVAGSHVWLTPPEILSALGPFDLDPCAAPEPRPWPTAARHIALPEDGLNAEWAGRVWCNPPFGDATWGWLERMSQHGNGVALAFARTDTIGFHQHVFAGAAALLFLKSRPHFYHPCGTRAKGNSGGPIVLIAYGESNAAALRNSRLPGAIVTTKEPTP